MSNPKTTLNNSEALSQWIVKDQGQSFDLFEAYLNNQLVFKKVLELYLPQPSNNTTINLRTFIDGEDTGGFTNIKIINEFIQPQITTGDLSGFLVELENFSEIQGNGSGADALILTSDIVLTNLGSIKGAGGLGGLGGSTSAFAQYVGSWTIRHHETSGCPNIISPRYWHEGGDKKMNWKTKNNQGTCNADKGPYSTVLGASSGGATAQIWGDQGKCILKPESLGTWRWRNGQADGGSSGSISYQGGDTYRISASGGGSGGAGQRFGGAAEGGAQGGTPSSSGPNNGFNTSTGYNLSLPSPSSRRGGRGGTGGDWGEQGLQGESSASGSSGQLGTSSGLAINGISHLKTGSTIGTIFGPNA